MAEAKGYDVYVVPGGSCIHKIVKKRSYDAILGVACSEELKLAEKYIKMAGLAGQCLPLTKNGCANTRFDLESFKNLL